MGAVAARAAGVDQPIERHFDFPRARPHRLGRAGDLVGRLAFDAQRDEQGGDLRHRRAALEHGVHRLRRLRAGEILPFNSQPERIDQHQILRKFRKSVCPSGVRIDSGWNCTPNTGSREWCSAMTMPSRLRALTFNSRGRERSSTTSE